METIKACSIEEINLELGRVLNFSLFKNSRTLSKFLEYIVAETLSDREKQIKEYCIAVNVLNRPSSFNSNDDAVVRIHAGRLRRALGEYYLTEGKNNRIIIDIPKGGYVPQFKRYTGQHVQQDIPVAKLPVTATTPTVALLPFKTMGKDTAGLSLVLGEELSAELSRFKDISVIGYYSEEMMARISQNVLEAGSLIGADYIITGNIQYDGKNIRIRVNLLITATGTVLMTKSFDRELLCGQFELVDEVLQNVVGAVGGYYGVIFQEMAKAPSEKTTATLAKESIFKYYQYQRLYSVENYSAAFLSLNSAVKAYPDNALFWAMLGGMYFDSIALDIPDMPNLLEEACRCSSYALGKDPQCQHALYTYAWSCLFRGEKESCLQAAAQCIAVNPHCSAMVAGAGFVLICAGDFERGFEVMNKAIKLNPYYPWWVNGGFSFYYLYKQEYALALHWAEKMNAKETFWDSLLKCVASSHLGNKAGAEKYLSETLDLNPNIQQKISKILSAFLLSGDLRNQITSGLKKAGLPLL